MISFSQDPLNFFLILKQLKTFTDTNVVRSASEAGSSPYFSRSHNTAPSPSSYFGTLPAKENRHAVTNEEETNNNISRKQSETGCEDTRKEGEEPSSATAASLFRQHILVTSFFWFLSRFFL